MFMSSVWLGILLQVIFSGDSSLTADVLRPPNIGLSPEAIPVPLQALGLLWSTVYGDQYEPLASKRFIMQLRKSLYTLIDRNCMYGDTASGVCLNRIARDYAETRFKPDAFCTAQRAVVAAFLKGQSIPFLFVLD